jgi:hypothetical protein
MVHRIDAKDRVEGIIIERQSGIGVRDFKCYPISLIGAGHAQGGGSDSCLIGVDARDSATHLIGEIPRRSAGATSDFENVMLGSKIKPRDESIVFLDCGPTVLTNVLAEVYTDRLEDLLVKWLACYQKINAFCHGEGLSVDRMWLDYWSKKAVPARISNF